jgi:hypothetical protein
MLTHIVYDEDGEIIQTHIEYSAEEERVCKCDYEEVLSYVDPELDRDTLSVTRTHLTGRPSTNEQELEIDVDIGRLMKSEVE